jgi:hypothetical protein
MTDPGAAPLHHERLWPTVGVWIGSCLVAAAIGLTVLPVAPPVVALAVALVAVALYVPVAGAGPSIQRAGVMGAAGLVAALAGIGRRRLEAHRHSDGVLLAQVRSLWDDLLLGSVVRDGPGRVRGERQIVERSALVGHERAPNADPRRRERRDRPHRGPARQSTLRPSAFGTSGRTGRSA